jgi:hypothetical protein
MHRTLVLLALVCAAPRAQADVPAALSRAHAARRSGAVIVDGKLDEAAWTAAVRQGGFTQRFPKDGVAASHATEFSVLYDDDAIYVAVWAHDTDPDQIRRLLTRRDVESLSDVIAIGIDSYHDRRTAYVFQLNAAGVQRDMLVFDDVGSDDTWDAVWTGEAAIDRDGWTAEFRIPLNQLRFSGASSQEWGLQVVRMVARTQEQSAWSPWPRATNAIASRFGIVDGIERVAPSRRLELLPYITGGVQRSPVEAGDPLNDRGSAVGDLGLDVKYGLGPAFTLSATLNPDFGQVEADPSQVNLSANELFFAEKRPFFVEGVDLFKLPIGSGDEQVENAFYSRRIGAAPDEPDADYAYIHAPSATTIYGAAKLTGKTTTGWSVGVLDAVTGEEEATIVDGAGTMSKPTVSPLTNYAVGRIKRDLRAGRTSVGASMTAVNRQLSDTSLADTLHDQAYTGGLQLQHRWADDAWELDVHGVGSWVHGTEAAISETQQANRHLFQRPDAGHVRLDETRTSLGGGGFTWTFGRSGETAHWRSAIGGDLRTPGLELNDAGFQFYSDRVENWAWTEYRDETPTETLLAWRASLVLFEQNTLEPELVTYGFNADIRAQLANYWSFSAGTNIQAPGYEPRELRGGPALRTDTKLAGRAAVSSDTRKSVRIDASINGNRDPVTDSMAVGIDVGATIQARSNLDIFVGPSWFERTDPLQYIDQIDDDAGMRHYVFGRIHQTTAAMTARINWTLSPRLSLQGYAQPFVAAGTYTDFKDVDAPRARTYESRFTPLPSAASVGLDNPDFNIRELRSTFVARWEYRPGSTVFAIWSHGQASDDGTMFDLGSDLTRLARSASEDIVMVKATYWIGL